MKQKISIMYKLICTLFITQFLFIAQGQILKGSLKDALGGRGKESSEHVENASSDQKPIIHSWEDGQYNEYPAFSQPDNIFPIADSKEHIHFVKDENGVISSVWFGEDVRVQKQYKPVTFIHTETVLSYKANNSLQLCFTGKTVISYSVKENKNTGNSNGFEVVDDYVVDRINRVYGSHMRYSEALKYVQNQRKKFFAEYNAELARKRQEQADDYAKNTLNGKTIQSITVIGENGKPLEACNFSGQSLNFEVLFTDGSKNSTRRAGGSLYIEDFACSIESGTEDLTSTSYEKNLDKYGLYKEGKAGLRPIKKSISAPDIAEFQIYSKFDPGSKNTIKLPLAFNNSASLSFSGQMGNTYSLSYGANGGNGYNGSDVVVQIGAFKHSETGEIVYVAKGGSYFEYFTKSIRVISSGGVGGNGQEGEPAHQSDGYKKPGDGGDGGNGGDGGQITLQIDPSIAKLPEIITDVSGGYGGSGGLHGTCWNCTYGSNGSPGRNGSNGNSGSVVRITKKVDFL